MSSIHPKLHLDDSGLGWCHIESFTAVSDSNALFQLLDQVQQPIAIIERQGELVASSHFEISAVAPTNGHGSVGRLRALLPAVNFLGMGDASFCQDYGIAFPYVSGSMANGIASVALVTAMAKAGCLGFFGAAGLSLERIEAAIHELQHNLSDLPFGINVIHSPNEPRHEAETVEMLLRHGIRLIEASAFLDVTMPLVRYRLAGVYRDRHGKVVAPNRILGKVSRVEVATKFFSPAPEKMVRELVDRRLLTDDQALLAKELPLCQDLTAEADSGGHTDNRPAIALLPTILALRDRMQPKYGNAFALRVGLGGGISTPASVQAAFSMGAAFIVTGSINQACVESGSSDLVRKMLAEAGQADTAMAPAADMFEMGVKVQVLKRGTMFAMRAGKLYDLYRTHPSIEAIPAQELAAIESQCFQTSHQEVWRQTEAYFQKRDPNEVQRAIADPKHRMALIFRWYLGQSSRWANAGIPERRLDYQVWCGPAMGAFNEWVKDTFLEQVGERKAVVVAGNLLVGAAVMSRVMQLRNQGIPLPGLIGKMPRPLTQVQLNERIPMRPI
jgi:trans-AT polyketide synthase, acyltransferase and oxidoreductase domains